MTLAKARAFVTHSEACPGRLPGPCAGHHIKALLANDKDPGPGECGFWLSQLRTSGGGAGWDT